MRYTFILSLILSLAISNLVPQGYVQAASSTINMTANGFEPKEITLEKGDTVTFQNSDTRSRWPASNVHPTHDVYPEFDPQQGIDAGNSWSFTFDKAGTWKMHDHIYPEYSGTITVQGDNDENDNDNKKTGFWGKIGQWFKDVWYRLTHWGKARPENDSKNDNDNIDLSKYDQDVTKGAESIFNDDIALGSHLKKFGAKDTITQLRLLETKFGSCHQPAHRAGHIGYKMFGNNAFTEYSAECQSGYYHGVMEAYFKEHGADDIKDSLSTLCAGGTNSFFEHQCIHGIGHGIMAWTNYELPEALEACDLLPKRQDSCWTGVFMENLAARLATDKTVQSQDVGSTDIHVTKYLSPDPQYPCSDVDAKYKGSCYFLQTSRMLQIFGVDFKKIAEACSNAPTAYQHSCFGSMGRDVGGSFPKDMAREIKECGYVADQTMRIECLNGAVQNSFWDPSGQDLALEFCRLLTNPVEKSSCYNTIFGRAPEVIFSKADLEAFCRKPETEYQEKCRSYIK